MHDPVYEELIIRPRMHGRTPGYGLWWSKGPKKGSVNGWFGWYRRKYMAQQRLDELTGKKR